jgi:hypothetical protein
MSGKKFIRTKSGRLLNKNLVSKKGKQKRFLGKGNQIRLLPSSPPKIKRYYAGLLNRKANLKQRLSKANAVLSKSHGAKTAEMARIAAMKEEIELNLDELDKKINAVKENHSNLAVDVEKTMKLFEPKKHWWD